MINNKVLTPEETAELLRVSSKTVRDWLRSGKLKGIKIGRQWRINELQINDIMNNGLEIDNTNTETNDWLNSVYDEDLPEYDWVKEIPKVKKVTYVSGKGYLVEDEYI